MTENKNEIEMETQEKNDETYDNDEEVEYNVSSLEELGLEDKNWKHFSRKYFAADKETSWKMLLDEYWDAKQNYDKYTDGTWNNMTEWLTFKSHSEKLEKEIVRRTMEENGYR